MGHYTYDSDKPHAVSEVSGHSMSYDANGNMLEGWNFTADMARSITWTSYNKPSEITQGDTNLQFFYGPDRARFKQIHSNGKTTLFR